MFDLDRWQEIFETIRKNRLRTFLTGFSVCWGIFMLIILLGTGTGLRNGAGNEFQDDAVNSIFIRTGSVSKPYKGTQPGKKIELATSDFEMVRQKLPNDEYGSARMHFNLITSRNNTTVSFKTRAVNPQHRYIENSILTSGRFLNEADLDEYRKVCIIGDPVAEKFFEPGEQILGEYLTMNKVRFKIVGTYRDEGNEDEDEIIYLPLTTAQRVYIGKPQIDQMLVTIADPSEGASEQSVKIIRETLAASHQFDPDDQRALRVRDHLKAYQRTQSMLDGITLFIWCIGIGTILAGIVGVSNIMMITVKDRTKEFGIRKALGATPWNIVTTVIQESLLITSVAGYVGLFLGALLLNYVDGIAQDWPMFSHPSVDFKTAISATLILILSGVLAGLYPAIRAANVKPIEALREE